MTNRCSCGLGLAENNQRQCRLLTDSESGGLCLPCGSTSVFDKSLSLNLGFGILVRPTGQQTLRICLPLLPCAGLTDMPGSASHASARAELWAQPPNVLFLIKKHTHSQKTASITICKIKKRKKKKEKEKGEDQGNACAVLCGEHQGGQGAEPGKGLKPHSWRQPSLTCCLNPGNNSNLLRSTLSNGHRILLAVAELGLDDLTDPSKQEGTTQDSSPNLMLPNLLSLKSLNLELNLEIIIKWKMLWVLGRGLIKQRCSLCTPDYLSSTPRTTGRQKGHQLHKIVLWLPCVHFGKHTHTHTRALIYTHTYNNAGFLMIGWLPEERHEGEKSCLLWIAKVTCECPSPSPSHSLLIIAFLRDFFSHSGSQSPFCPTHLWTVPAVVTPPKPSSLHLWSSYIPSTSGSPLLML